MATAGEFDQLEAIRQHLETIEAEARALRDKLGRYMNESETRWEATYAEDMDRSAGTISGSAQRMQSVTCSLMVAAQDRAKA